MYNVKIVILALVTGLGILYQRQPTQDSNKTMIHTGQAHKLTKDTQLVTLSGCTFTASKDWYLVERDGMIILEEPDRELSLVLLENTEPAALQAVEAAWKEFKPDFAYPIAQIIPSVAQDGWDEIMEFTYDTPTAESRFVIAKASRKSQTWYIQLVDGTEGAFERRMAQAMTVLTSFKVPGAREESFADKTPHKHKYVFTRM